MPHNSTGPGKKTTVFLSLRLPLVSGHFVSILRAKNTGRKRTSRDHGCSPVLLPCRSGRMSEIDADQCHFVMPFTIYIHTTHGLPRGQPAVLAAPATCVSDGTPRRGRRSPPVRGGLYRVRLYTVWACAPVDRPDGMGRL